MGGYIGATAVGLTTTAADVQGDITSTDTTPEVILKNTSEEDIEGGREGKITFKGEQSGGEETTLAQIESAHDGTADDEKGDLVFKTNDGNDGASPTERLRLDSAGDMLLSSPDPSLTITNTTHEDTDGGRESTIVFKGEQSGGELSTLAEIEASHDGTADDEKGDLIFKTNDGSDGASPTERVRIDSNGSILTATLGTDNVHLGEGAAASIASGGNQNVTIGKDAGTALTTGDSNTFIGAKVGDAITTASGNVAIGGDATYAALGSDTQGKFTTAIGVGALRAQNITSDTASNNVGVGYFAGGVMTTGTGNTFIGSLAGDDCVDGVSNVAVGHGALSADAADGNVAVGKGAAAGATGSNNIAIGQDAGGGLTDGGKNTLMGSDAGFYIAGGNDNTVIGQFNGNEDNLDIRNSNDNIAISNGDGKVRMYSNPSGYTKFKDDGTSGFFAAGGSYHEFNQNNNDTQCLVLSARNGSYVSNMLYIQAQRAATSQYDFIRNYSGGGGDIEHRLVGDGNAYADGSWNGGGADYAEYFEWADGNSDSQDRTGYTVVLDNEKIRIATSDDAAANIIGAVSVNASVIGDSDIERWKQKYLRNDFGAYQKETYTITEWTETVKENTDAVLDEDGDVIAPALPEKTREVSHSYETDKIPDDVTVPDNATVVTKDANGVTLTRRILNPDYNPDNAYVSRGDRQEWATIGLMGKLRIRKGQTTGDRWIKMRDVSDSVEEWLIR